MNVLETAKNRPVTSALVVLGAVGLLWFAFARQSEEPAASDDPFTGGFTYSGPTEAETMAATSLQIAQIEDRRASDQLAAQTALATASLNSTYNLEMARLTAEDAQNARQNNTAQFLTTAQLEEIRIGAAHEFNLARETNRSSEALGLLSTRVQLENIAANERLGTNANMANLAANNSAQTTARRNSSNQTVGTIAAAVIAAFF